MKIAYVAGPYTASTVKREFMNIRVACKIGQELAIMGFMPFVPHSNSANMFAQDYEFWIKGDIELMRRAADMVVLIPGWNKSPGAVKEMEAAAGFGLPIYYWPKDNERLIEIGKENT